MIIILHYLEIIPQVNIESTSDDKMLMITMIILRSEMHCKQIFSNGGGIFLCEHEVEFQLRKAIKVSR